jgi:glycosyltransferase involved in cell wall biosynthesis
MNQPLVSIILSCHNRAHLLPQTMESIFAQSYRPVEIVAVDDGSTDETPKLMKAYGDKIRYAHQENKGVAAARTTGGRLAKGEFIAFQDDDDLMAPDRINNLIDGFKKYPRAVLSVGDYAFLDPEGNLTGEKSQFQIQEGLTDTIEKPILIEDGYAAILWPKLTPLPHTTLFRRKHGENLGWFDPYFFHACSDTDFFARLSRLGPIVYVPKIVSYYRFGHSSIWSENFFSVYSKFLIFEKHIKSVGDRRSLLHKRLRYRLRETLKHILILCHQGKSMGKLPNDFWEKSMALLGPKDLLNFKIYATFIAPIREKLLGSNFDTSVSNYLLFKIGRKSSNDRKNAI